MDLEERNGLKNDLIQEVIYNLIYVYGPRRIWDIAAYFGVQTGRKASKIIRENLKILTDENWDPDPLIKVEDSRYVINDSWNDD
jgi:hypothetical protein